MISDKLSAHDVTEQDILDLIVSRQIELNELECKRSSDDWDLGSESRTRQPTDDVQIFMRAASSANLPASRAD